MQDNMINPYDNESNSHNYISTTYIEQYWPGDIHFVISNDKQLNQRTRYSFWQFVGDIGGFHDGLKLLVDMFFAPFVSFSFATDFVKKGVYSSKSTDRSDKK